MPGALHDCGLRSAEEGQFSTARIHLTELLVDHPASDPATAVPGDLEKWRDDVIKGLGAKGGCADTEHMTDLTAFLGGFDSGKVSALADEARARVPAGLLKCGVKQFERGQYVASAQNMDRLLDSYPRAKDADYAERIRIAAGIALVDPKAGVKLPARNEPEDTVTMTVYNYSPDPFEMVYTGPATGAIMIDACDDCAYYAEGKQPSCDAYSLTLPSTTFTVPAGRYLTATRHDGRVTGWRKVGVQEQNYTRDGIFCTYTFKR